jgi:hypothetical protein
MEFEYLKSTGYHKMVNFICLYLFVKSKNRLMQLPRGIRLGLYEVGWQTIFLIGL